MKTLWPHITSDDEVELMMIAIANNRLDDVKSQIEKGVTGRSRAHHPVMYPGEISMFHYACYLGNAEAAELLYVDGTDLEERQDMNLTPLMAACAAIRSPDWEADLEDEPQDPESIARAEALIRWLVERGADVNAIREDDCMTVLHWAATGCSYDIVSFLIARGAKVDWPPDDDQSAFILAARDNNVPALKALAEHGANINRRCGLPWTEGRTALGVLEMERSDEDDEPEAIAYLRSIGAQEWSDGKGA